jgi:hypothetical protein
MLSSSDAQSPAVIAALRALGELLASQGESAAVVVVGGTALILQGFVARVTSDVDVIAISSDPPDRKPHRIKDPEPMPVALKRAISRIARDFNLPADWLNTVIGLQWKTGLPRGLASRIHWEKHGGLWLGLVDRYDLIFLKLYAAADGDGPESVHFQDLMALAPASKELDAAERWVRSQDPSPGFAEILDQVLRYIEDHG